MPMIKREGLNEALVGDELLVTDTAGTQLMVMNPSALMVWSLCAEAEVDEIVELMTEIYPEVGPAEMADDVRSALAHFEAAGLANSATK